MGFYDRVLDQLLRTTAVQDSSREARLTLACRVASVRLAGWTDVLAWGSQTHMSHWVQGFCVTLRNQVGEYPGSQTFLDAMRDLILSESGLATASAERGGKTAIVITRALAPLPE